MNPLVEQLVREGVPVEGRLDQDRDQIYFDLRPETKSGMYLYVFDTGPAVVRGRYGEEDHVETVEDLAYVFAQRYRARAGEPGFGSAVWLKIAEKYGALQRKVVEVVTYE